jgi:hypothetical protein
VTFDVEGAVIIKFSNSMRADVLWNARGRKVVLHPHVIRNSQDQIVEIRVFRQLIDMPAKHLDSCLPVSQAEILAANDADRRSEARRKRVVEYNKRQEREEREWREREENAKREKEKTATRLFEKQILDLGVSAYERAYDMATITVTIDPEVSEARIREIFSGQGLVTKHVDRHGLLPDGDGETRRNGKVLVPAAGARAWTDT